MNAAIQLEERRMVIETYDKAYTVVQHGMSDMQKEIYVCRNEEDKQLYTVIRIKDKKITNRIIEFICEQKNNRKFSDLVDNFVYKEELHVVFTYAEGTCLEKRLKQNCTLEERMEIGKKLLEKLVLYQLPFYFQCQCLKMENIYQTDALDIRFRYTLEDIEEYDTYTVQTASAYLYQILKNLFDKELKKNVLDPMKEFLKMVQRGEEEDTLKMYRMYCDVCEKIKEIPPEDMLTSRNKLFFFWQKVKSLHGIIRGSIMVLVFLFVFGYMVYHIYQSFQVKGYEKHFESIGTVLIQDDGIENTEE